MFNAISLNAYFEQRNIPKNGRAVVEHIRASEPSRRTNSTPLSSASRYPSRKMGVTIQSESLRNELPAVYIWDHDDETHEFYDQPPRIQITYTDVLGRKSARNITPDFFVLQDKFTGWVECKTEQWLLKHLEEDRDLYQRDETGAWRCAAGEDYAARYGLGFKVRSSHETDQLAFLNLKFLSDFLSEDGTQVDPALRLTVLARLATQPMILLHELVNDRPAAETADIYRLIANGDIYVDLSQQRLSQPEFARVFLNQASSAAYQIMAQAGSAAGWSNVRPVCLEVGKKVMWQDALFEIVNVGFGKINMRQADGQFCELTLEQAKLAIKEQLLTSVADGLNHWHTRLNEILTGASADDLADARWRHRWVTGTIDIQTDAKVRHYWTQKPPSEKVIARWRRHYARGEATHGCGFAELITHRQRKGNRRRKMDLAVVDRMEAAAVAWGQRRDNLSTRNAWGTLSNECTAIGLVPPSFRTFRAACNALDRHTVKKNHQGSRAAYDLEAFQIMDRATPKHGERPFEVAHIDHTQLDIFLRTAGQADTTRKPWLTVMLDAYSRYVLAWSISFESPSYRSCMNVIAECVKRHMRMPDMIVSDSGAEFESIYYETLVAAMRTTKTIRAKSKPRFGSVLERFFGVNNQQFIHCLRGNNVALKEPRSMSTTHDPRNRAEWNLGEFTDRFGRYLSAVYHANEHPALGCDPATAFTAGTIRSGERATRLIAHDENFRMLCLPTTSKGVAKVIPGRGVKIKYLYYTGPAMRDPKIQNTTVAVRYEPMNAAIGFAYVNGKWAQLRSEYAAEFMHHSTKEIEILTHEMRQRAGNTGTRQATSARNIADFMKQVGEDEESMIQRRKDEEWRMANPDASASMLPAHLRVVSPSTGTTATTQRSRGRPRKTHLPSTLTNKWEGLNVQQYGEFK